MSKQFQLERYKNNPILTPREDVEWEAKAVFNPSVIFDDNRKLFVMLYRTYPKMTEETTLKVKRPGFRLKSPISCIGYAESVDGINFMRRDDPFISPETD